jgi:AraC-like DNA-binding protein
MTNRSYVELLHPKQPGFVLVTNAYKKYSLMRYGISHFYQFEAVHDMMSGIPDACVDIIFCSNGNKLETKVAGTPLEKIDVETMNRCDHFGVRFLPGYNPVGRHVKLEELVGKEIRYDELFDSISERDEFFEKIWSAKTFEQKIKVFLSYYIKIYDEDKYESYSLGCFLRKEIMQSGGNIKLNDLSEKTGYSLRYLNQVISEEFGMPPKELIRIIRFQKAIDGMTQNINTSDLTTTGLEAGYYDQSHFIKDFKEFTEFTPRKYINSLQQNCYLDKLQVIN